MTPQLTHDSAARELRILVHDQGDETTFDAYEFVLDELSAAHKKVDVLQKQLDACRREYAQLVSDNERDRMRKNINTVKAIAKHNEKGR